MQILRYFHVEIDVHWIMLMFFLPLWASCMVRNLKFLTPVSGVANVSMLVGICILLYFITQDLPPINSRPTTAELSQYPLFFATTLYGFEGIGLVTVLLLLIYIFNISILPTKKQKQKTIT